MKKIFVILIGLSLLSCSNETFPKYVALGDTRILEIIASSPEVNPGASVTLTPYVSDINSSGTLSFAWQACTDPGISYGAVPTCTGSATATSITTGTVSGLSSSNSFTGPVGSFIVSVPSTILALASTQDLFNGVNYLVTYQISNASGDTVKSFKRIVVSDSTKSTKNSNPVISQILANGSALGTLSAGAQVSLAMSASASSAESYTVKNADSSLSSLTETLQTTWFYSDGEVKYYRTTGSDTNTYTAPSAFVSSRNTFIVAVLRDGRGGLAISRVDIH